MTVSQRWMLAACLATIISLVNVQIVLPYPPPPPMFPFPPPSPIRLPPPISIPMPPPPPRFLALPPPPPQFQLMMPSVAIHLPNGPPPSTTTEQNIAVAYPMSIPLPVQVAIPALQPPQFCQLRPLLPSCPPCPPCVCSPSCTPSFFSYCSSCHQKCRCRSREDTPEPMPPHPPIPVPGPAYPVAIPPGGSPSVVVVPYGGYGGSKHKKKKYSSESSSSSDDESDTSHEICRRGFKDCKKGKRNRHRKLKRNYRGKNFDDDIKPVLSYISRNGDVKMSKRISNNDAADLLGSIDDDGTHIQKLHIISHPPKKVVFMSHDMDLLPSNYDITRKELEVPQQDPHVHNIIGSGRKELIFRPADHKTISNVSVMFQVQ